MTTTPALRIGGWLLAPLAWLLLTLLSTSLVVVMYFTAMLSPETRQALGQQAGQDMALWYVSLFSAALMWSYTLWLTIAFFKRQTNVPKHYIVWLLISVLLVLKSFAFSPVSDDTIVRQLVFQLIAAALFVPYFKRAERVKLTFVNPK